MIERFTSEAIELPARDEGLSSGYFRADLIFYGVDHSGDSYEARIFIDNPDADVATPREDPSFAGAFPWRLLR